MSSSRSRRRKGGATQGAGACKAVLEEGSNQGTEAAQKAGRESEAAQRTRAV